MLRSWSCQTIDWRGVVDIRLYLRLWLWIQEIRLRLFLVFEEPHFEWGYLSNDNEEQSFWIGLDLDLD